jgi:hypothetical protein
MNTIKHISEIPDRTILELILLNQVQLERRIDRMDIFLRKFSGQYFPDEKLVDYDRAPIEQDGRTNPHPISDTFKEMTDTAFKNKGIIDMELQKGNPEFLNSLINLLPESQDED